MSGVDDEMWFVLRNTANGSVTLERMSSASPHMDSMSELVAGAEGRLEVPPHLDGMSLLIIDSESGRQVGTPEPGRRYRVGLPVMAELCTMPMEGSSSFNSVRQFSRFKLRLLASDASFDYRSTAHERWEHFAAADAPGMEIPFTGALRLPQMPDADVGQSLCLRYCGVGPFCLLAITQEVDHHGK
jgi:hypothetical protein